MAVNGHEQDLLAALLQPLRPTTQSIDGKSEVGEQRRVPDDHRPPVDGGDHASPFGLLRAIYGRDLYVAFTRTLENGGSQGSVEITRGTCGERQ